MKSDIRSASLRLPAWLLAVLLTLCFTGELKAQNKAAHAGKNTIANDSAEAGLLRDAYVTLASADHDYKGHRAKAMKEIEAAAKKLGVNLKGDGKGHEPQGTSDAQLRAAQGLLEQITGAIAGEGLKHIQLAIAQLTVALNTR